MNKNFLKENVICNFQARLKGKLFIIKAKLKQFESMTQLMLDSSHFYHIYSSISRMRV